MRPVTTHTLHLTGDDTADALLSADDTALLIGMALDQQIPMEKAFGGPAVLAERLGGSFDVGMIAAMPEEEFVALCAQRPAIHRFPGSMGKRVHQLCQVLVERHSSRAADLWEQATTAAELKAALAALPGFGDQKAAIFVALIGKQRGVRLPGWREAAGPYGDDGVFRSVADVTDADSLARVRETKRAAKQAAKQSQ